MNEQTHVPVLIAGAGPVGLTLAADLAWRGLGCLLVDPKVTIESHPRAISIGVRSMEHFRRLGLAEAVIDAGVPRAQKLSVAYVTRMTGREIFRFRIPSIDDLAARRADLAKTNPDMAASPYYKVWTAQTPLERLLRRHLETQPLVEMRFGETLHSFTQDEQHVTAVIRHVSTGAERTVTADYLIGCDGASSTVRQALGIKLEGRGTLGRALGIHFRSPGLKAKLGVPPAVMYWVMAPGCGGTIYMIDGKEEWVYNRYFGAQDAVEFVNAAQVLRSAIGDDTKCEILSVQDWSPRQLNAPSYKNGRVFLAGDACHLFVPTGGFGMNTGIGDAVDLAWKIAAVAQGWGGPSLLDSYDTERRPIGEANTREAADNYLRSGEMFQGLEAIERTDASGTSARAQLAAKLPPKIKHFAPIGVHLGYCYDGSPLIVPDGTPKPEFTPATYEPTARPGHRAPHVWLDATTSTLDLLGKDVTLLAFGEAPTDAFSSAAAQIGLPITIHRIQDPATMALYAAPLVLVRPDGHVAWRGDPPSDARAILDRLRGA